jgi:hypothetical protein
VSRAQREVECVKRISRPVWRACKAVAAQMRREMSYAYRSGQVPADRLLDWRCDYVTRWTSAGRTCRRIIRSGWWIGGGEVPAACKRRPGPVWNPLLARLVNYWCSRPIDFARFDSSVARLSRRVHLADTDRLVVARAQDEARTSVPSVEPLITCINWRVHAARSDPRTVFPIA